MQLPLSLPSQPPRFTRDAFQIAEANEEAWKTAMVWMESGAPSLVITGPPQSGKSHLATIIVDATNGAFISGDHLCAGDWPSGPLIGLDDIPRTTNPHDLLTGISMARADQKRIVLVCSGAQEDWSGGLTDLQTRLSAMPRASLGEPDEELLKKVMEKQFHDRQISIAQSVIDFAALRIKRTFKAVSTFVDHVDNASLAQKKPITIQVAKTIIEAL